MPTPQNPLSIATSGLQQQADGPRQPSPGSTYSEREIVQGGFSGAAGETTWLDADFTSQTKLDSLRRMGAVGAPSGSPSDSADLIQF